MAHPVRGAQGGFAPIPLEVLAAFRVAERRMAEHEDGARPQSKLSTDTRTRPIMSSEYFLLLNFRNKAALFFLFLGLGVSQVFFAFEFVGKVLLIFFIAVVGRVFVALAVAEVFH